MRESFRLFWQPETPYLAPLALLRLAGFAVFRLVLPLLRLHPPRIVADLFIAAAYAVLAIVQLRSAGLLPGEILATSAVVTAVLAFAMQDTLGNVPGGLAGGRGHGAQFGRVAGEDPALLRPARPAFRVRRAFDLDQPRAGAAA